MITIINICNKITVMLTMKVVRDSESEEMRGHK